MAEVDTVGDVPGDPHTAGGPRRRVVLIGASNLVRSLSTAVEAAWMAWGRPLDVLVAAGHGRSFGTKSYVLWRGLPGILQCGLWECLDGRPRLPTASLVTDIGNDLLYGVEGTQIARWVESCLQRLSGFSQQIVITQLPAASLQQLGPRRFWLLRSILFPGSRLEYSEALDQAGNLNESISRLAQQYGAHLVEPEGIWYGVDPIHIRQRSWRLAWNSFVQPWCTTDLESNARGSLRRWLKLKTMRPQLRWMFGVEQRCQQPAGQLTDGTNLSFF